MSVRSLIFGVALASAAPCAALAEYAVIGDSLGVGVNWAAKSPFAFAKNSVAIHGGAILEQIRQLPRGVTAFMSLGTNDAVGGMVNVKKPVQDILEAAAAREVKLVWLGPPCVKKSWDTYAKQLDGILQQELKDKGVIYVGMRGADLCDNASLRGKEGVHFDMAGYTLMWQKAAAAAGFPVVAVAANEHPASIKHNPRNKPSSKKRRKKPARSAPAPKQEATPGAT